MKPTAIAARGLAKAPHFFVRPARFWTWQLYVGLFGIAFLGTSCSVLRRGTAETNSIVHTITGTAAEAANTNAVATLQMRVMREADQYVGAVAQASDDFRNQVGTTEARTLAQQWKLNEATIAYVNATDENPMLGAVGMVVLASLSRMVVEDYWVGEKFGEPAQALLETHRRLETNTWSLFKGVLTPAQEQYLRKVIQESRAQHPHMRYLAALSLPELAVALSKIPSPDQAQKPGSIFGLLFLNPLAGLDPTTQAIQQTRLLAQRLTYYVQRAPMLWGWRVELTTYQLAAQPGPQQLLSDVGDVGQAAKAFAKTAAELPQLVNDQREATLNQFFAGIASERTNIIADLTAQEAKLGKLLPEVRSTLDAGDTMARSLNATIQSLDAFMHYVSPPDTNSPPTPSDTNSPPFNILDYGTAAGQIGAAADKLNTLVVSLNQSLPEVTKLSLQAVVDGKAVVNHAFRLGLVLVVVLGIVAVLVVLAGRRLSR